MAVVKDHGLESVSARPTTQDFIYLDSKEVKLVCTWEVKLMCTRPNQDNKITGSSADIAWWPLLL